MLYAWSTNWSAYMQLKHRYPIYFAIFVAIAFKKPVNYIYCKVNHIKNLERVIVEQ